jgi:hypothetical protein
VDVVEDEDQRAGLRQMLEQRAHRPMAAIALVLERHRSTACERRQRRQHVREFSLHVVVESRQPVGVEALDVLIQRMHENRKRQVALQLRRRPREDEVSPQLRISRELRQQARLPNPRLAHQFDCTGASPVELVEHLRERVEFSGAPQEARRVGALLALRPQPHPPPLTGGGTPHDRGARGIREGPDRNPGFLRMRAAQGVLPHQSTASFATRFEPARLRPITKAESIR